MSGGRGVSGQARLERRYRRLLACYPRAFRGENEEEILAVLLACAEEGQQRPGLAASADLIKGAVQVRLRPAPGQPRNVRIGIRLMCAGAASHLVVLTTIVATAGSVRSAVARDYPGLAAAQHALNAQLVIYYVLASLGIVVWPLLTWALVRGRGGARIALAADVAWIALIIGVGIVQRSAVYAPADLIVGAVNWLIAASACVLLCTGTSGQYYHREPRATRAATSWRGTFGTM